MSAPSWHYLCNGRSPYTRGPAWIFQSDDELEIAIPWNWRNLRTIGEAETFLNTYVRMLEDRPLPLHATAAPCGPEIQWHPSVPAPVTCDDTEHKLTVL